MKNIEKQLLKAREADFVKIMKNGKIEN